MVDKPENILVEFDYNNISIIDPNKVVDENGRAVERLVKQENLVMYANLECKVLPRTKLAVGSANNDAIQTISIASINFLKPGDKQFLDNAWTDELTGKGSTKGEGVNQPKLESITNPNKSDDVYIRQTQYSNGKVGATDNGLLGITSINIRQNTSFMPTIIIKLVDVKGRALFEAGDNSPYAAFFNLPYPMFQLTIKGFYGKAIRLPLMLQNFNSSFNYSTGNFDITLNFYTYKYTLLAELTMGSLLAVPHMYKNNLSVEKKVGTPSQYVNVNNTVVEKGYQKVKEVYSEYKAKGLVPDEFPELTLVQMQNNIENFIKNIFESFTKENTVPLTNITDYQRILSDYEKDVYTAINGSWFVKYMDTKSFFIMNNNKKTKIYTFKKEINDSTSAKNELKNLLQQYNDKLNKNETVGENGSFKVNGKKESTPIKCDISLDNFIVDISDFEKDIDIRETYIQRNGGKKDPTNEELNNFKLEVEKFKLFKAGELQNKDGNLEKVYFWFKFDEGLTGGNIGDKVNDLVTSVFKKNDSFAERLASISKKLKSYREKIETALAESLSELLQSKDSGIGFIPNIRNVLAVIFANAEGFVRLLDDVHTTAWDINNNKTALEYRKRAIFNTQVAGASQDNLSSGINSSQPIYPWPQLIVETSGENGKEKYEIKYPGDITLQSQTKSYLSYVWPEVEFVEEFVNALTERDNPPSNPIPVSNEKLDIRRITFDSIEFPISNDVYSNKEEVKFFFEIYERLLLVSNNSKLSRVVNSTKELDSIVNVIAQGEELNMTNSLSSSDPFLINKLTEYGLNASNFLSTLKHFSNQGLGQNWQNFIRGIYNTSYIKNKVQNGGFELINQDLLSITSSEPEVNILNEADIVKYINESTTSNEFDFTDTYPFTNQTWVSTNLSNGHSIQTPNQSFNTTKVLNYNPVKKIITNYVDSAGTLNRRPITNFNFKNNSLPNLFGTSLNNSILKSYYKTRQIKEQYITEGSINYKNYINQLNVTQTTSIFNTPFFVNSIQEGVKNFRNYSEYPFISAAYYFINSLPLATLREKYKTYENLNTTDLDYIFATMKKFGAIHKVPYAWLLKIGSIWHRYKTYVETNVDILSTSWSGFNYTNNYDPDTNNPQKNYSLIINNSQIDIVLQKDTTVGSELSSLINLGFYPNLINDFNVFYQGFQVYDGFTSSSIQSGFNSGITMNYSNSAIINLSEGFDPSNLTRDLRIIPWSVTMRTLDGKFQYVMPSHGSLFNQTLNECFDINTAPISQLKNEVNNNQSMYDGSVRLFWPASNYGFFINNSIDRPSPSEYMKGIFFNENTQDNFKLGESNGYSKISEIFSVFEKSILDSFETMFLDFSRSIYDTKVTDISTDPEIEKLINQTKINASALSFRNFQSLMRDLMKVQKEQTYVNGDDFISKIQDAQLKNVTQILEGFLSYDVVFKYGNPSSFDRRLFGTFSQIEVVDPYTLEPYTQLTPNALPTNGGSVTLAQSKLNYPNEWKTLELYVGFSEIFELEYKDSGSYITDFFIDLNIAFNVENIKAFAPIIKIYATQKLKDKTDNTTAPQSTDDKNSYAILQDGNIVEVFKGPGPKSRAVLLKPDRTVISSTVPSYQPDDTIKINEMVLSYYGALGLQDNPITFIYIRPTNLILQPANNSNSKFNQQTFRILMTNYLVSNQDFQNKIITNLMIKLQKSLPKATITSEGKLKSVISGGDQTKSEIYETFKALNDKWISGNDFKTKTLFEDVLLLDRASRNVGDKILVDIFKLKDRLTNINAATDVLTFVQTILIENHFVVMNLPSYVNFYNVQDAVKNPIPKPEGTLEFANTMFGTFLNVDYRDSSSKMVCFYGGKPSEIVDMKNNVDFRYRSDAFELRRASDNPLIENQIDKKDWSFSNKVVGFNVDIGPQNQQIFVGFDVSQTAGKATAESIEILNQMANQNGNRGGSTKSTSLYNLYKNRSYSCQVTMMGNALIQPTMYFNLRNVPMFSGPYMILEVNHSITPGNFTTSFRGIRQPTAALPKIDDFVQSLRVNLLKTVIDKIEQDKKASEAAQAAKSTTVTGQGNDVNKNGTKNPANTTSLSQSLNCTPNQKYSDYVFSQPNRTKTSFKQAINIITSKTNDIKLQNTVFSALYLSSGQDQALETNANNYSGIDILEYWGQSSNLFYNKLFYCSSDNTPFAHFESIDDNIQFLIDRWSQRMGEISNINKEDITKFLVKNSGAKRLDDNVYNSGLTTTDKINLENKVKKAIDILATQTGQFNQNVQTTANPLKSTYINTTAAPIRFQQLKIEVDPTVDGPRNIFNVTYDYKITSNCSNGTTYSQDITDFISTNKQTFIISFEDILTEVGCINEPNEDKQGNYFLTFTIRTVPVKPDGSNDTTRNQYYKSYKVDFKI